MSRSTSTSGATSTAADSSGTVSVSLSNAASVTTPTRDAAACPANSTSPSVQPWSLVAARRQIGHWEIDTVLGKGDNHCILTLVERATGAVLIGKLHRRNVAALNARLIELVNAHPGLFKTITADNGTEFHGFDQVTRATGVPIYFANPYHSWERGTNENTNGLIRQYLPKRTSMKHINQEDCNAIASALNNRPRKRYGFRSPLERLS